MRFSQVAASAAVLSTKFCAHAQMYVFGFGQTRILGTEGTTWDDDDIPGSLAQWTDEVIPGLSTGGGAIAGCVGDLDGDELPDVVHVKGENTPFSIRVVLSSGDGSYFDLLDTTNLPSTLYYGCEIGDFNNDGHLDILIAPRGDRHIRIVLNDGDGQFTSNALYLGPSRQGTTWNGIKLGDMNNDGFVDVVAGTEGNAKTNKVYYNSGVQGWTDINDGFPPSNWTDLPQYIHPDNRWPPPPNDSQNILYWKGISLGDLNNDGYLDIAAATQPGFHEQVMLSDGSGGFTAHGLPVSHAARGAFIGDVNGDGLNDIVVSSRLYLNQGGNGVWYDFDSAFPSMVSLPTGGGTPCGFGISDFNSDGRPDLVLGVWGSQQNVLINTGASSPDGTGLFQHYLVGTQTIRIGELVVYNPDAPHPLQNMKGASTSGGDTAGPWEIQYIGLSTDFSNISSSNEISSDFFIGKDRESEVLLLDKDCESNITDIGISTTKDVTPNSTTFNLLTVHHDIDKSSIANSSIWNGTSSELEVCQIVRLVLPASETGGNGKMIVAEDTRQIKIGFEMTADFNITAGLAAATVFNETATTDVSSFVSAYKCNADDTDNEDTSALAPNDELSVCVVSEDPNEVNVKELVSMTAIQNNANLAIVENRGPFLNSLTSIISISDGVMVTTRLPSNSFQFADGNSVTIQGQVEMELADGSTRKLRVLAETGIKGDEKASYDLEVKLQEGDAIADDGAFAMGSPATAAAALDKAFAFAVALAFVFAA